MTPSRKMLAAWKINLEAIWRKSCFSGQTQVQRGRIHSANPGWASHCPPYHSIACFQRRWWQFYSVLPETAGKSFSAGPRYCREFNRRHFKPKEVFCSIPSPPAQDFNHSCLTSEQDMLPLVARHIFGHSSQLWSAPFLQLQARKTKLLYLYPDRHMGSPVLPETHFPETFICPVKKSHCPTV